MKVLKTNTILVEEPMAYIPRYQNIGGNKKITCVVWLSRRCRKSRGAHIVEPVWVPIKEALVNWEVGPWVLWLGNVPHHENKATLNKNV